MGDQYNLQCTPDCNPDAVVTQMQEERDKFSHDISQEIRKSSNILRFAEKTKRPFPSGMGDTVKTMVLDIPQPSHTDVIGHQKRLQSARPGNSPCDIPCKKIPYGSHTVEACIFGWCWETDWFCKADIAFKHSREKQLGQVKQIMSTWAKGIWSKWVWRSYQRSVQNWVLNANLPNQHGASGYPSSVPTSILTIPFLDAICQRLDDAAGMIGSPVMGKWCVLIGETEMQTLFEDYYKSISTDYGARAAYSMESHKRYDPELGGMNSYELGKYKFFTETHAPRYRDREPGETWEDALLDDRIQVAAQFGTESKVPESYRNPQIAKYAEILIWNEEAVNWLTPPMGLIEDNGFHKDERYSYAGEFIPVRKNEENDPHRKLIKYHSEYVAGMESIFPKRGAAILALACHVNPKLVSIDYNLEPTVFNEEYVTIQEYVAVLPVGTMQIQTKNRLPNFADGFSLFLVSAGDKRVKVDTVTSEYCAEMGYYLHTLTFVNPEAGACVPRQCDRWKKIAVLPEDTEESVLLDEQGCALCGGGGTVGYESITLCASYIGDNIAGVTIGEEVIEEDDPEQLEADIQTYLDENGGGTVVVTAGDEDNSFVYSVCITGGVAESFTVEALDDDDETVSFESEVA